MPNLGHGEIVRDDNGQLRDDLSRLWCACGKPAVIYLFHREPLEQFLCLEHMPREDKEDGS